ncbi:MAG: tRNA uridine-5-carboxymethylaminomethyl(34) synthesis GTPase MnmE [Dehalococcoidia bacterium]|nr:tRNA uridine-5-carboxymethylaminomethyl(34) synthesis GTPase MnmE [Dehalococcoidia bacterium]
MYQDTIVAISTPIGEGGIGIVRLSGSDSRSIAAEFFQHELSDHKLVHGHIIDPKNNEIIDEVLVSYMAAPHTYTREDVVEINCHGGPMPLRHILQLALHYGARLANPGEFTLRAFLNGRLDLAQAESVADIISAKTEAGLRVAMQGLGGKLSGRVKAIRSELMAILAYFTARVDFPEDEVEERETAPQLEQIHTTLKHLVASADRGMVYRQGVRTAIVGRPNVGKSSLLNHLLRENRAIVTPIPGTTRDIIEETVSINGIPFILGDTAGITDTADVVESMGVERSRKAVESADLILFVLDTSTPLTPVDKEIATLLNDKKVVMAANKSDLPRQADASDFPWDIISTCALTGEGIPALEEKMTELVLGGEITSSDTLLVSNPRHKQALERASSHIDKTLEDIAGDMPDDFITIDITNAVNAMGEITGETIGEELLESIFSQFCIGK